VVILVLRMNISAEKASGKDFMMKQELIDAAEASGLSRDAIGYSFSVNSCCFDIPAMFDGY